ncbi:MAG: tripartite tricarboxylate transporter TctB family protein [Actinomycetes bacterium]
MSTSTEAGRVAGHSPEAARPSRSRGAIAVDLVLLGALVVLFTQTVDLAGASRHFPLVTLVVTSGLVLLDLAIEAFPVLRTRFRFLESDLVPQSSEPREADAADEREQEPQRRTHGELAGLAWLLVLGLAMYVVGYVLVTPVFLVLFSLWARVPVRVWVPVTVVLTLFNYFVFFDFLMLR